MCFVNWYGKTDNIAFCGAKLLNFLHHQYCYSNKHTWTKQNGKMGKSQNRNRSGLTPWVRRRRRRRRRSMWLKVTVLFSFLFLHIEYAFGYTSAANICVSRFFFFFWKSTFLLLFSVFSGSHVLFMGSTNLFIQQLFH